MVIGDIHNSPLTNMCLFLLFLHIYIIIHHRTALKVILKMISNNVILKTITTNNRMMPPSIILKSSPSFVDLLPTWEFYPR